MVDIPDAVWALSRSQKLTCHAAYSIARAKDGPLSLSLSEVEADLKVNITSLYAAASEAVKGFESLPEDATKTFAFVGNKQSHGFIIPSMVSLGMGKAAAAYMIGSSAAEYSKKGFKYADVPGSVEL
jgi:hypothetical protein